MKGGSWERGIHSFHPQEDICYLERTLMESVSPQRSDLGLASISLVYNISERGGSGLTMIGKFGKIFFFLGTDGFESQDLGVGWS